MNPFELLTAIACYEDYKSNLTACVAVSFIALFYQLAYLAVISFKFGELKKSHLDPTSNTQQGPQKDARRFKKWASTGYIIIGLSQIIIGFIQMSKATFAEECWLVVINGLINIISACYIIVKQYTTIPIGERIKLYREIYYIFWLLIYAFIGVIVTNKIKNHPSYSDYTTYALMAFVGFVGAIVVIGNHIYQACHTPVQRRQGPGQGPAGQGQGQQNSTSRTRQPNPNQTHQTSRANADSDIDLSADRYARNPTNQV